MKDGSQCLVDNGVPEFVANIFWWTMPHDEYYPVTRIASTFFSWAFDWFFFLLCTGIFVILIRAAFFVVCKRRSDRHLY